MKKRSILVITILLIASLLASCYNVSTAGSVNGEDISIGAYSFYATSSMSSVANNNLTYTLDALKALDIDGKDGLTYIYDDSWDILLRAYAAEQMLSDLGEELTDEEKALLDEYILSYVQEQGGSAQFESRLSTVYNNLTYTEFKAIQHRAYMESKLKDILFGEGGEYEPSEDTLRAYFDGSYVWAKHILISTVDENREPLPEDELAEKTALANDILARLDAGEDFDTLMNEYSEDTGLLTNPNGYVFTTGEMVKPFEDAAFALEMNERSGLVESDYGYHIILRMDSDTDSWGFEQKKGYIISTMTDQPYREILDEYAATMDVVKNEDKVKKNVDLEKMFNSLIGG